MKREKIYAMFKNKTSLRLYNKMYIDSDEEEKISMQYITDGRACYALENLPLFDGETILGLLGVDSDDKLQCIVDTVPDWFGKALADYDDSDVPLHAVTSIFGYTFLVTWHHSEYDNLPEMSCFINPSYLSPPSDEDYDLYSRVIDGRGTRWIIVKAGLITKAVIVPIGFSKEALRDKISWLKEAHSALIEIENTAADENEKKGIEL